MRSPKEAFGGKFRPFLDAIRRAKRYKSCLQMSEMLRPVCLRQCVSKAGSPTRAFRFWKSLFEADHGNRAV